MIVIKLQGGLGNQMFQYAFAKSLSEKAGTSFALDAIQLDGGEGITKRNYALDVFKMEPKILTVEESKIWRQELDHPFLTKIKRKFGGKIPRCIRQSDNLDFLEVKTPLDGDTYFDGYFQSERYFKENENIIRENFVPKDISKIALDVFKKMDSVENIVIQIRRGDYVTNTKVTATMGVSSKEYFTEAVTYISSLKSNCKVFVISDDIEWCKKELTFSLPIEFISNPLIQNHEEIWLMSQAKNIVISNSSFGWWGAWLNQNKDAMKIAPKKWFKKESLIQKDIIPQTWIRM